MNNYDDYGEVMEHRPMTIKKRPFEGLETYHLIQTILHEHRLLLESLGFNLLSIRDHRAIGVFSGRVARLCEEQMQKTVDGLAKCKADTTIFSTRHIIEK